MSIFKELHYYPSGRVRAYGQLSPLFVVSIGARQGCPISPFKRRSTERFIWSSGRWVELLPWNRAFDLKYTDNIPSLSDDGQIIQWALDSLAFEVSRYGMRFAPSKCKMLSQDWWEPVPADTLCGNRLGVVNGSRCLWSAITCGGGFGDGVSSLIVESRAAFANLRRLWRRQDIRLPFKQRVYNAPVPSVLRYGCETWSISVEIIRRIFVFDHRYI